MRRTDRLFEIIQSFRSGRLLKAQDIADKLEVSVRTIYRDIETLIVSGVPIEGERGLGYVMREAFFLPPLSLKADELEALRLGVDLVKKSSGGALASAAETLFTKVSAVLPPERLRGLSWSGIAVCIPDRLPKELETLPKIKSAIQNRERLRIGYEKLDGAQSSRVIRPLQLEFWGKIWTLTAWCEGRGAFRVFRVDLIQNCELVGSKFDSESGKRLVDYLATTGSEREWSGAKI